MSRQANRKAYSFNKGH
ncbi:hypothetical protein AYI69_g8693, partial [Smittium culicis]